MSLYHTHRGPRTRDMGKFQSRSAAASSKSAGGEYRGWHYTFVAHQTGSSVKRTSYAVSIRDAQKNPVEYLRGFSSIDQATRAAYSGLDAKIGKFTSVPGGQIGTIPSVPTTSTVHESR